MGAGIKEQFSDVFIHDRMGIVTGVATATQFPSGSAGMVRFKAWPGNSEVILIGVGANFMLWPMDAGDDTGWIATDNLNRYWHQSTGSNNYLSYWLQV